MPSFRRVANGVFLVTIQQRVNRRKIANWQHGYLCNELEARHVNCCRLMIDEWARDDHAVKALPSDSALTALLPREEFIMSRPRPRPIVMQTAASITMRPATPYL